MKYVIVLVLIIIGCVTSANNSAGSTQVTQVYHDGCYYLITSEGGITDKVNQPLSCTE